MPRYLRGGIFMMGIFYAVTVEAVRSTWRAILAGQEVLKKGLVRRVCDGSTTGIWLDRWLPSHFKGKPLTPAKGQSVDKVSDLMTSSGGWDESLIRDSFFPVDANAILKVPTNTRDEDFWAWEKEKHGNYSVKSAYQLLEDEQDRTVGNHDGPGVSDEQQWKLIWKLDVPPKVKVFWWRVLHEYLPAKKVLHKKHIEPTAFCETYGADEESIRHVLVECTVAKLFWDPTKALIGVKLPVSGQILGSVIYYMILYVQRGTEL